jgi:hypothetical protein
MMVARSIPAASITARASSIRWSRLGNWPRRSERPVPRLEYDNPRPSHRTAPSRHKEKHR